MDEDLLDVDNELAKVGTMNEDDDDVEMYDDAVMSDGIEVDEDIPFL